MKSAAIAVIAILAGASVLLAQEAPPKPVPEHKKLDVMAGSWLVEGDLKPSPMGPGGKVTENETCEWMEGGFYVVCHVDFKSAAVGNGTGLSILGYSTAEKAYTYREFNSWGEFEDSRGTVDGDTWTWTSDEKMPNGTMKGRFTMKFTSASAYNFTFEMSPDGAKWSTIMDGKATKK